MSPELRETTTQPVKVMVTDIDMQWGSMVWFMIKWATAAVPAVLFLATIIGMVVVLLSGVFRGLSAVSPR